MAQATRTSSTAPISDDPLENAGVWMQANSKSIMLGLVGAALIAAGIFGYRYLSASKIASASTALYQAQGPLLQGNLPAAQAALQAVSTKYSGTGAGQQATLLLAQVLYDQKQYQGALTMLEKEIGSASQQNKASYYAMMAAGYEGLGNLEKAADSYGKAVTAASSKTDKGQYKTSQARSLMLAGKLDDAAKLFKELLEDPTSQFAQEAHVRLGEIAGASVK